MIEKDMIKSEIENINNIGKNFKGKRDLLSYLNGKKLTPIRSIRAHCYQCMGYFSDGKDDCGIQACPLYPYMMFNKANSEKRREKNIKNV